MFLPLSLLTDDRGTLLFITINYIRRFRFTFRGVVEFRKLVFSSIFVIHLRIDGSIFPLNPRLFEFDSSGEESRSFDETTSFSPKLAIY